MRAESQARFTLRSEARAGRKRGSISIPQPWLRSGNGREPGTEKATRDSGPYLSGDESEPSGELECLLGAVERAVEVAAEREAETPGARQSRRRARSGAYGRTLKGNKAQGSNGRDVASNGGNSQRTYQWSKALKAAFAGETGRQTKPGNGVGEKSRGVWRAQARSAAVEASERFGASRWTRQFEVGTPGRQRPLVNIGSRDFGFWCRW